jgi:small multidrug resistance pump
VHTVWSGLGTTLIAVIGIVYFRESLTLLKAASIALVIVGVVGLRMAGD